MECYISEILLEHSTSIAFYMWVIGEGTMVWPNKKVISFAQTQHPMAQIVT